MYDAQDTLGKDIYGVPIKPERGRMLLDKMVMPKIELRVSSLALDIFSILL